MQSSVKDYRQSIRATGGSPVMHIYGLLIFFWYWVAEAFRVLYEGTVGDFDGAASALFPASDVAVVKCLPNGRAAGYAQQVGRFLRGVFFLLFTHTIP